MNKMNEKKKVPGNSCSFCTAAGTYYGYCGYKMSSCHFSKEEIDLWSHVIIATMGKRTKITRGVTLLFYFIPQVKYKEDYEKNKAKADYNVLPASENPLLRQLKAAGNILSDVSQLPSHVFLKLNRARDGVFLLVRYLPFHVALLRF